METREIEMHRKSQRTWLRIGAGMVIASGLLVAPAAHPATGGPAVLLADLLFWPLDGAQTGAAGEARLLAAIGGGVMVGWGWALWLLAGEGMDRAPDLARRIILGSVGLWFVVDSTGSIAAGAPLNVVGNLAFLVVLVLPLWRGPVTRHA
jgi:hypothetical protein